MSNLFARFKPNQNAAGAAKVSLFFKENNQNGYKTIPETKDYLNGLQAQDFEKLELLFEYAFKKFPINNVVKMRIDPQDGEQIVWLKFKLPNSNQNIRIICDEDILRFIQDYQQGIFRNGFLLEDLLIEAGYELAKEA